MLMGSNKDSYIHYVSIHTKYVVQANPQIYTHKTISHPSQRTIRNQMTQAEPDEKLRYAADYRTQSPHGIVSDQNTRGQGLALAIK